MSWHAVVTALDDDEAFRSRVSVYLHPLAGRAILWHVVRARLDVSPRPAGILVLHRDSAPSDVGLDDETVRYQPVEFGDESRAMRAAVTSPGMKVMVDGAAPLLAAQTIARLLRAGEHGVAALPRAADDHAPLIAVAGEGPALASADDPRLPRGAARVAPTSPAELLRVVDRHSLGTASEAVRDRLVRAHEARGVSFILAGTTWLDVDVRIGADTVIYPGVVLEGETDIGSECVIGPHSRVIESVVGRGVELKGWNYVCRAHVRNRAVLEPYAKRGVD